jgi:hypothetical protein
MRTQVAQQTSSRQGRGTVPCTENDVSARTEHGENLRFQDGVAIVGNEVVVSLTYTPLSAKSKSKVLKQAAEHLSDLFSDLTPQQRGRVIVECTGARCQHWLLLHVASGAAATPSPLEAALDQRATLLQRLQGAGLKCRIASSAECMDLARRFPQPHIEDRRVVDHHGRTLITLTMRESGEVTQPGITRDLTEWLCSRDELAYMVLDFRGGPANAITRFGLTLLLTARDETEGQQAAQEVEEMMLEGLGALAKREPVRRTMSVLDRMAPFARVQPRLPAFPANIADLFPL